MEEVRKRLGDGELPAWRRPSSCPLGLHLDPHSFHSASPIGLTLKIACPCPRSLFEEAAVSCRPLRTSNAAGGTLLLQVDIWAPPT